MIGIPSISKIASALSGAGAAAANQGTAEKLSINDFVSSFKDFGRSNMFQVEITGVSFAVDQAKEHLAVACKGIQVPGVTFTEGKYFFKGYNRKSAIGADFDPITLTFLSDSGAKTVSILDEWKRKIQDLDSGEFGYKDDYQCTINIRLLDGTGNAYETVQIIEAYPTNFDARELSWDSSDSIIECSVSFNFTKIESVFNGVEGTGNTIDTRTGISKLLAGVPSLDINTHLDGAIDTVVDKLPYDIPKMTGVTGLVQKAKLSIPIPTKVQDVIDKSSYVDDLVNKARRL
jgi:hypothetical protein